MNPNQPYYISERHQRWLINRLKEQSCCVWCGTEMHADMDRITHPCFATREHMIPMKYGGLKYIENLRYELGINPKNIKNYMLSCSWCNTNRGFDIFMEPMIPLKKKVARTMRLARIQWARDHQEVE